MLEKGFKEVIDFALNQSNVDCEKNIRFWMWEWMFC